ncbi:MAG: hypothetical protein ACPGED_03505 [Flavobacteriales bacterium]
MKRQAAVQQGDQASNLDANPQMNGFRGDSKVNSVSNFDTMPNAKVDSKFASINDTKDSAKYDPKYFSKGDSMPNHSLDKEIKSVDSHAAITVSHNTKQSSNLNAKCTSKVVSSAISRHIDAPDIMLNAESKETTSDEGLNAKQEPKYVTIAHNNCKSRLNGTNFDRHSLQSTMRQTVARLKQNLNNKLTKQSSWRTNTSSNASVNSVEVPASIHLPSCHQTEFSDDECTIEFHCMNDQNVDDNSIIDTIEPDLSIKDAAVCDIAYDKLSNANVLKTNEVVTARHDEKFEVNDEAIADGDEVDSSVLNSGEDIRTLDIKQETPEDQNTHDQGTPGSISTVFDPGGYLDKLSSNTSNDSISLVNNEINVKMKEPIVPSHQKNTHFGMLPEKYCQIVTKIGVICPSPFQTVVRISPLRQYQCHTVFQTGTLLKPPCQTVNQVTKVHEQDIQTVANLDREPTKCLQPVIPAVILMNKLKYSASHLQAYVSQGENSIFFLVWNWHLNSGETLHTTPDSGEFSIKELTEHYDETNLETNFETKCAAQVNSICRTICLSQIENSSHDSKHMGSSAKLKTNCSTKYIPLHNTIVRNSAVQVQIEGSFVQLMMNQPLDKFKNFTRNQINRQISCTANPFGEHWMKSMINATRKSDSKVIFEKISAFLYNKMDDEEESVNTELKVSVSKGDNGTSGSKLSRIPRNNSTATLLEDDDQTKEMPKQGNIWDFQYCICIKGSSNVFEMEKSLINVPVISDNVQELFIPYVVVLRKKRKPPDKACKFIYFRYFGGFLRDFNCIFVIYALNTQGIGNNSTILSESLGWSVYQESRKRIFKPSEVDFKHQEWIESNLRRLLSDFMILSWVLWTDRGF